MVSWPPTHPARGEHEQEHLVGVPGDDQHVYALPSTRRASWAICRSSRAVITTVRPTAPAAVMSPSSWTVSLLSPVPASAVSPERLGPVQHLGYDIG